MGNGESDGLRLGKDPSSTSARFSDSVCVWEEARCGIHRKVLKADGQTVANKADQTPRRA